MAQTFHRYRAGDKPVGGYKLIRKLGEGGFGEVWHASAPGGAEVALKFIDLTGQQGFREFKSLRLVKKITHNSLTPLHGFWLKTEDGTLIDESDSTWSVPGKNLATAEFTQPVELIVAMGLGKQSLYDRLRECQQQGLAGIPADELLDYMGDAAKGIDYLNRPIHDMGNGPVPIVHSDVKPHNILIVGDGAQVCDFGLAQAAESLRKTSAAPLTLAYAAPESFRGKPCDKSDQYSLAITYVELRTGSLPFDDSLTGYEVMTAHVQGQLDFSRLSPAESAVIRKATAVSPEERWSNCREMVLQLRRSLGLTDTSGVGVPHSPQPIIGTPTLEPVPRHAKRPQGTVWSWLIRPFVDAWHRATIPSQSSAAPLNETTGEGSHHTARESVPKVDSDLRGTTAPSLSTTTQPGPITFGAYEIIRLIGQGSAGIMYMAQDGEGNAVALKVFPGALFAKGGTQRLVQQIRLAAKLSHPNLCQIIDAGQKDADVFIAMEYLNGRKLDTECSAGTPLSLRDCCIAGYQLIDVLNYLRSQGVVHRDVKPANIMRCEGDRFKLLDLGLGKRFESDIQMTMTGCMLGTPSYMAPEQVTNSKLASPVTDLYGAGVTLFQLLTGRLPYQGTVFEVFNQVLHDPPPDVRSFGREIPNSLAKLVSRLLAKSSNDRPKHDEALEVLGGLLKEVSPLDAPNQFGSLQQSAGFTAPIFSRINQADVVERLHRVEHWLDADEAPDIVDFLPRHEGNARLGNYYLRERIGVPGRVTTYRAEHYLHGFQCIARLLPPEISKSAPDSLRKLLTQRGQLMEISMHCPHLTRLLDVGETRLTAGAVKTIYYTIEDFQKGRSFEELVRNGEAIPQQHARDALLQSTNGLATLHAAGFLHGNLHAGKVFYDVGSRRLRITDLSHARLATEPAVSPGMNDAAITSLRDDRLSGTVGSNRRQYIAPEQLCDDRAPTVLSEQYALGVIFVECLIGRAMATHENDLKLLWCVREDIDRCLMQFRSESRSMSRVLGRMVAHSCERRYSSLVELQDELMKGDNKRKKHVRVRPNTGQQKPNRGDDVACEVANVNQSSYDVFICYRRETDSALARAIKASLENKGLRTFLDVDSLKAGPFDVGLLRSIERTPGFVVVLSPGSLERCENDGDWMRAEIAHAIQSKRTIVPIRIPEFQMPPDEKLPAVLRPLRRLQHLIYHHEAFGGMIDQLIDYLKDGRSRVGAS